MESPSSFLARSWSRAVAWASPRGKRKLEVQRDEEEEDHLIRRRANKRARSIRTEELDGPEQARRYQQRTEEQSSLQPPGTPTSKAASSLVDHLLTPVKHLVPHGRAFVTALFSVYGDSGVEPGASAEADAELRPRPPPSLQPAKSATSLVETSSTVPAPPSPASSTSPSSPPDTDSSLYTYIDLTTGDDEDDAPSVDSSSASFNYSALPRPGDEEEEEEDDEEKEAEEEESSVAETTKRLEEERALADQEWRQGPLLAALRDAFAPRGAAPRPRAPDLLFDLRRMEESQMLFRETLAAGPRGAAAAAAGETPRGGRSLERTSTPRRERRERRGPSTSTSRTATSFSSPSTSILDAIVEAKRLRSPPPVSSSSSRRARARQDELEEADEPSLIELAEADAEFGASRLHQADALGRQFWTALAKCESRKRVYDYNRSTWTEAIDKSQAALEQTQSAYEAALIELRAEEQRRRLEKARAKWLAEDRRAFSAEEQALVKRLLKGNPSEVLVRGFNAELTRSDLQRLRDTEWLNDEVINFYLNLLQKRSNNNNNSANPAQAEWPKVHFLNTFFYPLLSDKGGYNYARVQKWTRRVDLLAMHRVVIPIHLGNHWCLAVINIQNKRFEYYDSLGGSNRECLQRLRRYLQDEARDKKKMELDLSAWPDHQPKDIPQQKNGYDCGVFACKFAECVASGRPFYFSQVDMPLYRKRMLLSIYNQTLQ